jgi:arginine N-succinyltransferase
VIGRVHSDSVPAIKLLESEGFSFTGMVDIFEAGPIVSCATDEIRTVRDSKTSQIWKISAKPIDSDLYLISNTYSQGFRATAAPLAIVPGKGIEIDKETSLALDLKKGDAVRIAPLRPMAG